ncbi:hypothetical protein C8Q77DRAFT_513537 [Trametes polyzona]|nr:hypothetical protein C8Q77DRAFT_513537 [Trametes polyzona]
MNRGKLGEFFWESGWHELRALRIPASDLKIDEFLRGPVNPQRGSSLFGLPVELFAAVVAELADEDDGPLQVLCLAVTCKAALSHIRKRILDHHHKFLSYHARHRMICIGEYTQPPPEGMLNADETQQLTAYLEEQSAGSDEDTFLPGFYGFVEEACYDPGARVPRMPSELEVKLWSLPRENPSDPKLLSDASLFEVVKSGYYPEDRPWALCNLTKREYVREDAAREVCRGLPPDVAGHRPSLWHFVLACICWSYDETSIGMPLDEDDARALTRGRWAGDKLAIVLIDRMDEELGKGPAWTDVDVTAEVGGFVELLWKSY